MNKSQRPGPGIAKGLKARPKMQRTVLLVDDDPSIRSLVRLTLDSPATRVLEAACGRTALELIEERRPDVIILDWVLPGISGLEILETVRARPGIRSIPIMMLTSRGEPSSVRCGLDAGADAYLVKPFSPIELATRIESVLDRHADVSNPTETT